MTFWQIPTRVRAWILRRPAKRGRVCLLRKAGVEVPSDLLRVTDVDPTDGWKLRLVTELRTARLDFDATRAWG